MQPRMQAAQTITRKLLLLVTLFLSGWLEAQPPLVITLASGRPGPRVLVVSGIHGNEPSGPRALDAIAKTSAPSRGVLILVPAANPEALAAGTRSRGSPAVDLNRAFPGTGDSRAAELFALTEGADLVLDLHEAGAAWPEAGLPTLVVSPAASGFAMELLEALQARETRFAFTGGAPAGSLVGELGARDRQALVVEVPARLSMKQRIRMHRLVVEVALGLLGMR